MSNDKTKYHFEGLNQEQRYPKQLSHDYVKIDELSFEDLLVFASGFSYLIKFVKDDNTNYTDWSGFFLDETMVLAEIITFKADELEKAFKTCIDNAVMYRRTHKKVEYTFEAITKIYHIAALFEFWLDKLTEIEKLSNTDLKLRMQIDDLLALSLNVELAKAEAIQQLLLTIIKNPPKPINFRKLLHFRLPELLPEQLGYSFSVGNKHTLAFEVTNALERIFSSFFQGLFLLKENAPELMRESLKKHNHLPQVSLYLTFTKLYKYAQDNINQFNKRFLNYYYREILQFENKTYRADKVYLSVNLLDNARNVLIKKGHEFLAGEDKEGHNIVYLADQPTRLNHVSIKKLYSQYVSRNQLNIKGVAVPYVTNLFTQEIPEYVYDEKERKESYKVFGTDQSRLGQIEQNMEQAEIGFAFSSKNLYLTGGKRVVDIEFEIEENSFNILSGYINNFTASTQKLRNEIVDALFLNAFKIYLTAEEGWFSVSRYSAFVDEQKRTILVSFIVPLSAPAISYYNADIHQGNYTTRHPLIKFVLNPDTYIFSYSIIQKLHILSVEVKAKVEEFKDLVLYNHLGQLDIKNVFHPFGPIPKKGHFFVIGSKEVFFKEITDLTLNFRWFELPESENGFEEYYEKYDLGINNHFFKGKISILDSGKWKPEDDREDEFCLFAEDDERYLEEERTVENIDISKIWRGFEDFDYELDLEYSHQAQSGFLKVELSAPDFAFAHEIYPNLLAAGMAKNAKGFNFFGSGSSETPELPQPYAPQLEYISINYEAVSSIQFSEVAKTVNLLNPDGEHFYHIHPYGEVLEYPRSSVQKVTFLPDFNFEGAFLIGLNGVEAPQTVSFLFEIDEFAAESSEVEAPLIEWQFLSNDKWSVLEPSKIYLDETDNFRQTGMIVLELPETIKSGNAQLSSDLYWIRVLAYKNTKVVGSLATVHTQVFTATFDTRNPKMFENIGVALSAKTIKQSVSHIPGVAEILQPLPSFEGKLIEPEKEFVQRISEFLKHKNRAITTEDFEKIILSNFPQVFQATCFPNMSENAMNKAGHVLILVVPYTKYNLDVFEPKVGNKLLVEIKEFIQKMTSPFIHIEVRNPVYEHIKVMCKVRFRSGFSKGFYTRELNNHLFSFLQGRKDADKMQVALGGSIYVSDILSFMRTLPYIDTVGTLSIVQVAKDFRGRFKIIDTARMEDDKNYISATKPWSVIVPFAEHEITVVDQEFSAFSKPVGLGQLKLGSELIVE